MEGKALRKPLAIGIGRMQGGLGKDAPCARQLPNAQRLRRECPPRGQGHLGGEPSGGARKARAGR
eukprot:6291877-Alexandrium_andersonii.AAC.1